MPADADHSDTNCPTVDDPRGAPSASPGVTPPDTPGRLRLKRPKAGALEHPHAEHVLAALQRGGWIGTGRFAKRTGRNFTYLGDLEIDGRRVGVSLKQTVARPGLLGAIQFCSPRRRSARQWAGARRLCAIRVPVARPILLARGMIAGEPCDWLLLEHVPGVDLLRHLTRQDLTTCQEHAAARQAGELVCRIDSYGWFNRDTKLSNLIRTPDGGVTLVDTVNIRRRPGRRVRMLRAMLFEAIAHDVLPRRALMMRCLIAAVEDPKECWRALEREARREQVVSQRA